MAKSFYEQKCRICGCDWNHACNDHDYWFAEDICSACAEKMKPILFNTPMVQAILDGRKTTTRRVIKPQPTYGLRKMDDMCHRGEWHEYSENPLCDPISKSPWGEEYQRPIAEAGDILYVRETFFEFKGMYEYKADGKHLALNSLMGGKEFFKWQPSIFMPKKAARVFLRVTDVKAERLQDITEDGAKAEGLISTAKSTPDGLDYTGLTAYDRFGDLWNSTVKKSDLDKYGWDANPWAWVYQFERIGEKTA